MGCRVWNVVCGRLRVNERAGGWKLRGKALARMKGTKNGHAWTATEATDTDTRSLSG